MFKLTVAAPEQVDYEGNVSILNIETINGHIGILTDHAPFLDVIVPCEMTFIDETGKRQAMAVSGGYVMVWANRNVTVLVNAAEFDYNIDFDKAMKQKEQAEKELSLDDKTDLLKTMHLRARLEKAVNRINIINSKKN
ncbi:MAG: ATP synthase F1 subunit epsilon [Bacilli bacterium]|jgi:F-type H+-transporting ATPase subunit epsilon|nr:ATP synthase F1 subunit epsilon [Bacilli bacterium]